jgi:hypothetical protein
MSSRQSHIHQTLETYEGPKTYRNKQTPQYPIIREDHINIMQEARNVPENTRKY